jgi:hypothetical protein
MKSCNATVQTGPRRWKLCGHPAKFMVERWFTPDRYVCGWHARAWLAHALRRLP